MINKARLEETQQTNLMPINQLAFKILARIQRQDKTQAIQDHRLHLTQLLDWAIAHADLADWVTAETLAQLLWRTEDRLTPTQMMQELTESADGDPMIDKTMFQGSLPEVEQEIAEMWMWKKVDQGIIQTRQR